MKYFKEHYACVEDTLVCDAVSTGILKALFLCVNERLGIISVFIPA